MNNESIPQDLATYFAVHAPEVPDWFEIEREPGPDEPRTPPEIEKEAREWRWDPCYDLDGIFSDPHKRELASAYNRDMDAWRSACAEHRARQELRRQAIWRWKFAAIMMELCS